jgi:hypothetical protein
MRFHALPSIRSLEPLEARLLLSADVVAPLLATFDGMLTSPAGETVSLIQGSGETSQKFIDAGDFYWSCGKQVSLLRVANEAVVRFRDPTTAQSALSQVTAPGSVLEGYEWSRAVDPEMFVFRKQAGGEINFDALNQGLHASGIAEWADVPKVTIRFRFRRYDDVLEHFVEACSRGDTPGQMSLQFKSDEQ